MKTTFFHFHYHRLKCICFNSTTVMSTGDTEDYFKLNWTLVSCIFPLAMALFFLALFSLHKAFQLSFRSLSSDTTKEIYTSSIFLVFLSSNRKNNIIELIEMSRTLSFNNIILTLFCCFMIALLFWKKKDFSSLSEFFLP